uniref:Right handed beta helix domain-containing protein n=1 Tax=Amphimedon queenslandica TaxID=400682 RepID=A0A1X7VBK1_AMPQE
MKVAPVLCLLLIQTCCLSVTTFSKVICIHVNEDRPTPQHNCSLCRNNLSSAMNEVSNDTMLLLLSDKEIVETIIEFVNVSGLTISGMNKTTIVCNQQVVTNGFKFINITDLKISGLSIVNCGILYHYKQKTNPPSFHVSTAAYFENCTNIDISGITVRNSHGAGLTLFNCDGLVSITHSTFTNNTVSKPHEDTANETGRLHGGGGVYYELSACSPSWDSCDPSTNMHNKHSSFIVYNCTFSYNSVIRKSNNLWWANGATLWASL